MKDFIISALPYVIIGICIAVISADFSRQKTEKEKSYIAEGMCIGISLGVAFSSTFNFNLGLGISLGMLVGETIGIFIKKK